MELLLILLLTYGLGGATGLWVARNRIKLWRGRAQTATRLLNEEKAKTLYSGDDVALLRDQIGELGKKVRPLKNDKLLHTKRTPEHARMTARKLRGLTNSARVDLEIARLKAGKPPLDDLHGLTNSATTRIVQERLKHGWD